MCLGFRLFVFVITAIIVLYCQMQMELYEMTNNKLIIHCWEVNVKRDKNEYDDVWSWLRMVSLPTRKQNRRKDSTVDMIVKYTMSKILIFHWRKHPVLAACLYTQNLWPNTDKCKVKIYDAWAYKCRGWGYWGVGWRCRKVDKIVAQICQNSYHALAK